MVDDVVTDALQALASDKLTRSAAGVIVPRSPGLYAFHGDEIAWSSLGLVPAFDGQPLYVGKAERSLNGRDVGTHFATGKTGSSTVRRSLAALLVDELDLVAVPRNQTKPDGSANFGPGRRQRDVQPPRCIYSSPLDWVLTRPGARDHSG